MPTKGTKAIFSGQRKKYTLFRVFEILNEFSDENHHLKHTQIKEKLSVLYGLNVERKTIRECIDDINYLGAPYGIEVYSEKNDGAFLLGRRFEKSEIGFLIDAVFSSKSIGQKQAQELTEKLQQFLSRYDKKTFNYIAKSGELTRTKSKQVFFNIDVLLEAIDKNKKIRFNYNRFYFDEQKNEKMKSRKLVASPYFLINNQGSYYLVCNNNYFDDIANYKIERMANIELLDEDIKPIKSLKGYENGIDIAKYANENIYMFSSKTIDAKIRIENEYIVSYVQDWFGGNARIYQNKTDGNIYADIHGDEQAIVYWCLQYGESIELVEPQSTREKIKEIVDKMTRKYN